LCDTSNDGRCNHRVSILIDLSVDSMSTVRRT